MQYVSVDAMRAIEKRVQQLLPTVVMYQGDLKKVMACVYHQGILDGLEVMSRRQPDMREALKDNG